jgi:hypothetical protein
MTTTQPHDSTSNTTTSTTTHLPAINPPSPSTQFPYPRTKIKNSTHLGITIRWSGAAAPWAADAAGPHAPLLIFKLALILWWWCSC